MIIYLAGAMRRQPRYNLDAATAATQNLRSSGHHVISPWEHDAEMGFNFDLPLEEQPNFDTGAALAWDLAQIIELAAPRGFSWAILTVVVVLPGWEQSAGFRTEAAVARALGLRILQYRDVGMWTCNDKVDQWLTEAGYTAGYDQGRADEKLIENEHAPAIHAKGYEQGYERGHTAGWLECRAQNKANLEAWVNAQ